MQDHHGSATPIGPLLDALDVKMCLEDNEQITDALVITRVVNAATGHTALGVTHNGLDWITQAGLLAAAQQVELAKMAAPCDGHES